MLGRRILLEGRPSLLTFREVTTLFHELGHALQHMLTTVDLPKIAGTEGVEWDAVELASQFMENWCYDKKTLGGLTQHIHTGESLPDDLYEKILAAKNFRSGSNFLRQLYFGFLDMALHHGFGDNDSEDIASLKARIAQRTHVLMPLPEDRFLCAFMHIFGGGYAAGYYSYKWAEVLSADAFAAFEELGLENDEGITQLGKKYRDTVLALGGSQHPMDVFKAFRGREPSSAALLRHSGLDQSPAQRSKI